MRREEDIWPIHFRNDSGETIPKYGAMRCVGMEVVDGEVYLKMDKPNTYGSQYSCYINGRVPILAGKDGRCTSASSGPAWAAILNDRHPDFGDLVGPVDGEWRLYPGVGGFIVRSQENNNTLALVERAPLLMLRGKASGASSKGATDSIMAVYHGEDDSGYTVEYVNKYGDISNAAWMRVDWVNNQWEAGIAECEVA